MKLCGDIYPGAAAPARGGFVRCDAPAFHADQHGNSFYARYWPNEHTIGREFRRLHDASPGACNCPLVLSEVGKCGYRKGRIGVEWERCPDCGFVSHWSSAAGLTHDNLCSEPALDYAEEGIAL